MVEKPNTGDPIETPSNAGPVNAEPTKAGEISQQRFRKKDRIVRQQDFDRVHQQDWFSADKHLVVKAARNGFEYSRLGLSISRRVGNAVVRNRWKRAIREAFRRNRKHLPTGWDIVVRPRKGAKLDREKLARSLTNLSRRIDSSFQRQSGSDSKK